MLCITHAITIKEKEINLSFIRSSGPGGQNVNKVATAVQIRFDAKNSPSLPEDVRKRLFRLERKRITDEGILILTAKRFRTQERNRIDGLSRLTALIRNASKTPKLRRKTMLPKRSKENRLQNKKNRSSLKKLRQPLIRSED